VTVPQDDAAWRELIRGGQPPFWRLMADGTGGRVWEREGTFAAIIPAAPGRSVFNSVFYEESEALLSSLEEIATAYDEAGVKAWTVWVPEADSAAAEGLERAGHKLDAEPRDMGMELSELRELEPDPDLEIREREDYAEMARLNEIAYGYSPGEFSAVADSELPGVRIYFGALDGEEVSTLAIWPHGSDAVVAWVATAPEGRGRGVSTRLMARALADAHRAGMATSTLQATKLGRPVYEKLGYRDFGAVQMWERREEA
jgi:GNAT superfamily N-acetyltransferase